MNVYSKILQHQEETDFLLDNAPIYFKHIGQALVSLSGDLTKVRIFQKELGKVAINSAESADTRIVDILDDIGKKA